MPKDYADSSEVKQSMRTEIGSVSFATLLKKEILDNVASIRFIVLLALCVLLIPLSLYVNHEAYQQWLSDYNEQLKIEAASRESRGRWGLTGVRPPSPLAVFANGIETSLAKDFAIDWNRIEMGKSRSYGDPIYELFGKIDFLFVVQAVLSLIAFLFAFDAVSGEKEMGMLKLCLANPVPRYGLLLGKLAGGMLVLVVPFLLAFGIGLAVLTAAGYPLFGNIIMTKLALMLAVSIVYIATFYLLGLLISSLTHQSKTTLILLMSVWVVFVLAVPRLSVVAARIARPVEDDSVIVLRKKLLTDSIQKEKGNALKALYFEKAQQKGLREGALMFDQGDPAFVRKRNEIAGPFEAKIREELAKMDADNERQKQSQLSLARNIARISPASIFAYLMTDIADTGEEVKVKFLDSVRLHYANIDRQIFSKSYQDFISEDGRNWGFAGNLPGEELPQEPPRFEFTFPKTTESLAHSLPDVTLLLVYAILFFAAATVAFVRYDVR